MAARVRAGYRILDEPRPTGLARLAVSPLWPLLGMGFGGAWLAWPWFVLNAHALGAPTLRRTYTFIAAGVAGTAAIVAAYDFFEARGAVPRVAGAWVVLGILLWKLAAAYALFQEQEGTSELFVHFRGRLRNGAIGVALGLLARLYVLPTIEAWFAALQHVPVWLDALVMVLK